MSIYKEKRKSGTVYRFSVYYTDSSGIKKRKRSKCFPTKSAAVKAERQFLSSCEENTPNLEGLLFEEIFEEWVEYSSQGLVEETRKEKLRLIPLHFPALMGKPIESITANELRKYLSDPAFKNYSTSFKNKVFGHLRSVFEYARRFYDLDRNPMDKLDRFKKTDEERLAEVPVYTIEEFNRFLAFVPEDKKEYRNLFYFLYWTGLRRGEALGLTFADLKDGTLYIHRQYDQRAKKWRTLKTKGSKRKIQLDHDLLNIIRVQKELYSALPGFCNEWFIFGGPRYLPYQTVTRTRTEAMEAAGLEKVRLHSFRHSHVSNLIAQGVSPIKISQHVGHSSLSITLDVYSHLLDQSDDEILKAIDKKK